ncbi:MAG: ClbS/DfsB family four-helix bundle protein [Spirochaetales bacterium]|nr:ClbS/DfsB family four-helix bundle protein [Spirochaetales bacterium]
MPRAKTKEDLLKDAQRKYEQLTELMQTLPKEVLAREMDFSKDEKKSQNHWQRDKNLRDVLVHLYEWHQLLITWVKANMGGTLQSFLPHPYNWKTYGEMNMEFWKKHQKTPLEQSKLLLHQSHHHVFSLVESLTNEELFTRKYFSWTGNTNLGSYCVSALASHYDWAIKKLKAHKKKCQEHALHTKGEEQ